MATAHLCSTHLQHRTPPPDALFVARWFAPSPQARPPWIECERASVQGDRSGVVYLVEPARQHQHHVAARLLVAILMGSTLNPPGVSRLWKFPPVISCASYLRVLRQNLCHFFNPDDASSAWQCFSVFCACTRFSRTRPENTKNRPDYTALDVIHGVSLHICSTERWRRVGWSSVEALVLFHAERPENDLVYCCCLRQVGGAVVSKTPTPRISWEPLLRGDSYVVDNCICSSDVGM